MKKNRGLFVFLLVCYPLAYATFPNEEYTWQASQTEETFWGKHKNKIIGGALLGSAVLLCLGWHLKDSSSPDTPSILNNPDSGPKNVLRQGQTNTLKQDAQPTLKQNQTNRLEQGVQPTEDILKKAHEQIQAAQGQLAQAQNDPERLAAQKALDEAQREKTLAAMYYEGNSQAQRTSFDELWKACKDDKDQKEGLKKAFYEKLIGNVTQAAMDAENNNQYVYHNVDVGNKTDEEIPKPMPPLTFQEAQKKFQEIYGSDILTPFDKYEIALRLQTKGVTKLESIYQAIKTCIEKNKGDGFICPDFDSLKNHPELLTITGEIRTIIKYLATKGEYRNSQTFDLHKFGLLIRNNPDLSLGRAQRSRLYYAMNVPLEQAKKILLNAAGQATSQAYQQAVAWLTLGREVAGATLAMEGCFLDDNPDYDALDLLDLPDPRDALVQMCRDEETNTFKQNLFNNAFAQAQELLKAHQEEPAYKRWCDAMQGIEQCVNRIIEEEKQKQIMDKERNEFKKLIAACIPAPYPGEPSDERRIEASKSLENQGQIERFLRKYPGKKKKWFFIVRDEWHKAWGEVSDEWQQKQDRLESMWKAKNPGSEFIPPDESIPEQDRTLHQHDESQAKYIAHKFTEHGNPFYGAAIENAFKSAYKE